MIRNEKKKKISRRENETLLMLQKGKNYWSPRKEADANHDKTQELKG